MRAQAYNTLGVALARLGRLAEAVEQIEQQRRPGRGARSAAGRLPRLHEPRRALRYARSAPQHRDLPAAGSRPRKKVGDLGFQSRLYANLAVAYCALTNRCEAEGIEAAHAAIDLDRRLGLLDHLAVPLIVLGQIHQCHGDHAAAFASLRGGARAWPSRSASRSCCSPATMAWPRCISTPGDQAQAEEYLAKAQAVCERAGLEPDALMVLPFLC